MKTLCRACRLFDGDFSRRAWWLPIATLLAALLVLILADVANAERRIAPPSPHRQVIVGSPGIDYLHGRGGPDDIYGLGGDDRLFGGRGPDFIMGGGGMDIIRGGPGRDIVWAVEVKPQGDLIFCGPAFDIVYVDDLDLSLGCERVVPTTLVLP